MFIVISFILPVNMYKIFLLLLCVSRMEATENTTEQGCPMYDCMIGYQLVKKNNESCPTCVKIEGKQTNILKEKTNS